MPTIDRVVRLVPLAVVMASLAIYAQSLATSGGVPSNDGLRRFVVGAIADGDTVYQGFSPRADGLSSITIYPRPYRPDTTGSAIIELRDVTSKPPVVVASLIAPNASLVAEGRITLSFPSRPSLGRKFELALHTIHTPLTHAIGLLATRGEGYTPGVLRVNGWQRNGDLVFETSVDQAQSNFAVLVSRLSSAGVPAAAVCLLLTLAIAHAALYALLAWWVRAAKASIS